MSSNRKTVGKILIPKGSEPQDEHTTKSRLRRFYASQDIQVVCTTGETDSRGIEILIMADRDLPQGSLEQFKDQYDRKTNLCVCGFNYGGDGDGCAEVAAARPSSTPAAGDAGQEDNASLLMRIKTLEDAIERSSARQGELLKENDSLKSSLEAARQERDDSRKEKDQTYNAWYQAEENVARLENALSEMRLQSKKAVQSRDAPKNTHEAIMAYLKEFAAVIPALEKALSGKEMYRDENDLRTRLFTQLQEVPELRDVILDDIKAHASRGSMLMESANPEAQLQQLYDNNHAPEKSQAEEAKALLDKKTINKNQIAKMEGLTELFVKQAVTTLEREIEELKLKVERYSVSRDSFVCNAKKALDTSQEILMKLRKNNMIRESVQQATGGRKIPVYVRITGVDDCYSVSLYMPMTREGENHKLQDALLENVLNEEMMRLVNADSLSEGRFESDHDIVLYEWFVPADESAHRRLKGIKDRIETGITRGYEDMELQNYGVEIDFIALWELCANPDDANGQVFDIGMISTDAAEKQDDDTVAPHIYDPSLLQERVKDNMAAMENVFLRARQPLRIGTIIREVNLTRPEPVSRNSIQKYLDNLMAAGVVVKESIEGKNYYRLA